MIVVSDTTPLRYLIEVDAVDILPRLFGRVMTAPVIVAELRQEHFPARVRHWAGKPPAWLQVVAPKSPLPAAQVLDAGEAQALALAVEHHADRLLIDENAGVDLARKLHLPVLRTLTLLAVAGEMGLIPLEQTLTRLAEETQFRATKELFARFMQQDDALRMLIQRERAGLEKLPRPPQSS